MIKRLIPVFILAALSISSAKAEEALDPQQLFDEAMQLRMSGDIFAAIETFELILGRQPGLQRARLELAVAYHQARRFYDAREQLMKVYNDPDTPENVKLTITAYLAQLGSDEKSIGKRTSSSVFVSTGLFSDSNVNLGPAVETLGLDASSRETSGSGLVAMASYSHVSRATGPFIINRKPVNLSWHSQATVYGKMHTGNENEYNLHVLGLTTGPEMISDKDWRAVFNLKFDKIYFGGDPYSFNIGLNPSYTLIFGDTEILFENLTTVRDYSVDTGLNGIAKMYGVGVTRFFKRQTMAVEGGLRYHNNGADAQFLNSKGVEVYAGGQIPVWRNARAYMQLSTRGYEYTEADPSNTILNHSTIARDETETRATVGVSHDFREGLFKSWSLNGQVAHTNNSSNLAEFDYDRNVIELNLRRYFY